MTKFTIETVNIEYPDSSTLQRFKNKRDLFIYFYEKMVEKYRDEVIVLEHTNNFIINRMFIDDKFEYYLRKGYLYYDDE